MRICLLLLVCLLATSPGTAGEKPNVLFLLSDDQRPDTIHALGNETIQTPNLDRLVARGTSFTRAVCSNPICTPSRAEILSGRPSFTNGVSDFGGRLKKELVLWPQAMKDAGYRTGYVGKWHNDGRPIEKGFDETPGLYSGGGGKWYSPQLDWRGNAVTGYRGWIFQSADGKTKFPEKGVGLTPDISEEFADAAIEFLEKDDERPFFLQVNFTAPHDPLFFPTGFEKSYPHADMPLTVNYYPQHPFDHGNFDGRDEVLLPFPRDPELIKKTLAVYYAVISHLDEQVGRILETLESEGEVEKTIVIYSSDHGLGVGSHGIRGKQNMYEHTINVPMILAGPGVPGKRRELAQVYLRDLYPTVCDLCGIPIPETVQAKSFGPVLRGEVEKIHPYSIGYFRNYQRMIRTERWKLIEYPHLGHDQLFDLERDPYELRNRADEAEFRGVVTLLKGHLREWQRENQDPLLNTAQ